MGLKPLAIDNKRVEARFPSADPVLPNPLPNIFVLHPASAAASAVVNSPDCNNVPLTG
jgi:hypothetical protein